MKPYIHYIILTVTLLCSSCSQPEDITLDIVPCAPLPIGLASATAFVVGEHAYVFGGRDQQGTLHNELWMYSSRTDTWHNLGETPLTPRVHACACAAGEVVYIGLGFNGKVYNDDCYLQDWWCYSPQTNTWEQKANLNSKNSIGGVPYREGDTIYVAYSSGYGFSRDIQMYSISDDSWTMRDDNWHRAKSGLGITGCTAANRHFLGTGFNTYNLNQWFEVDLLTDTWTPLKDVPNGKRSLAACAGNEHYVYIMGGRYFAGNLTTGKIYADIERYSLATDNWDGTCTMPYGEAENMIAFTIGENVYFGLGEDAQGNIHQQLYRIED